MNLFKKIFIPSFLLLFSVCLFGQKFPERPNPPKLVNDFTNTLTREQIQTLESKLVALDDATSTQIAIIILPNTDGASISDYNAELLRKWGVGSKEKNNGIILLVAKDDRKLDIATGYGLEGALTDANAKSIIDDIIVPNFKGNDYYRGVDLGTDAIVQAVKGQYNIPRNKSKSGGGKTFIFMFIAIIIFLILSRKGGGGGSYMSRRGQTGIADALFWNLLLNSGGRGGGGGWSGGDSGGGGFGGFGGGGGGGGGASGSW